jgi:DMSO reductase family type II enzyme chaperone
MSAAPPPAGAVRAVGPGREPGLTAAARCRCYAALSELTASPHDVDAQAGARERRGATDGLPFAATELDGLLAEFAAADPERLRAEYSGLFEVGSQGPPVPIREDLQTGQRGGTREDIVRFYDYFGYRLGDRFAWAPDHLSVELEFMHYLAFHEARDDADRLSWQLAQADFAERHLANWLPQLAAAAAQAAPGSFYARVLAAVRDFVLADVAWQATTIRWTEEGAR